MVNKVVGREDYFSAAIEILAEADHGGLKQSTLCRRLRVTTGSFYNYFGSWAGFKSELLQYWLDERTVNLAAAARDLSDPQRMLRALTDFACELPHRAEAAIRSWSHSDPEVRRVQEAVDAQRYQVAFESVLGILGDETEADHITCLGLFILNGYQQMQPIRDVSYLRRAFDEVLSGLTPERTPPAESGE
ncbi:TetR/AcrR family transcriptional regulator [Nocardia higoensis]|uniref:TetR/AcrR family transcriptional regulator n=1 Tax=Nocardia higoensis TaxID=228599 RepID=UPI0002E47200|nr:TetR/AcrR family transcriptional regulator [Nocardia higoensis]